MKEPSTLTVKDKSSTNIALIIANVNIWAMKFN